MIVFWGHDTKKWVSNVGDYPGFENFYKGKMTFWAPFDNRLTPTSALHGGRTESFATFRNLSLEDILNNYSILHLDVCSLYPTMLRDCEYPLGHPQILIGKNLPKNGVNPGLNELRNYFGIWSCRIIPPKDLRIPILPIKKDRLIFGLCGNCVSKTNTPENQDQESEPNVKRSKSCSEGPSTQQADREEVIEPRLCFCTDEEWKFNGAYCSPELILAVENGYEVIFV